jgi:hypothetical protein
VKKITVFWLGMPCNLADILSKFPVIAGFMKLDSSVGTGTDYGLDGWGSIAGVVLNSLSTGTTLPFSIGVFVIFIP